MNETTFFKVGKDTLTVSSENVRWGNKIFHNQIGVPVEIRYGTKPIELDMFTIGVSYRLELRDKDRKKLLISLKSYFGMQRIKKFDLVRKITDIIWDKFFSYQFAELINSWETGQVIKVDNYKIDSSGIVKGNRKIDFSEMEVLSRYNHLIINSALDSRRYMNIPYLDVWNWPLIEIILKKALERENETGDTCQ